MKKQVKNKNVDWKKLSFVNVEKFTKEKDFLKHFTQLIVNSKANDFYFTIFKNTNNIFINFTPIKHFKKFKRIIEVPFYIRHLIPSYCKFVPELNPGTYLLDTALLDGIENVSEHLRSLGFIDDKVVSSNIQNLYSENIEMNDFIANLLIKYKDNNVLKRFMQSSKPEDFYISFKDNYIYSVPKKFYDNFSKKQILNCPIYLKYKVQESEEFICSPEFEASDEQVDEVLNKDYKFIFSNNEEDSIFNLGNGVNVAFDKFEEIKSCLLAAGYEYKNIPFVINKTLLKKEKECKKIFEKSLNTNIEEEKEEHHSCTDKSCTDCNNDNSFNEDKPLIFEDFPETDFSGIKPYHIMGLFSNCNRNDFYAYASECNHEKSFIFIVPKAYWDKYKKPFKFEMPINNLMPTMAEHYKKNIWLCEGEPYVVNRILNIIKFDVNEEFNKFIEQATLEELLQVEELKTIFTK